MKCFQINFKKRVCLLTVLMFVLMTSCIDRYENMSKYQRPDVLDGKLFDLISNQDSIKMELFAQLLMDTKFDSLINKTGTYAVFAPNDSAMRVYLQKKYGSTNLDDMPLEAKDSLVRFHILQMPWNKDQLQSLSSKGWINPDDLSNNEPTAFKRKTLFKPNNKLYQVKRNYVDGEIVEVILRDKAGDDRIVYNDVNKYVPLFFDDFLSVANLSPEDYTFYFDRPYESNNVYFANAKILGDEQFAENGFLYEVDQVVDVLPNAEEILLSGKYSRFLDLIYNYSEFDENEAATNNQDGADEGLEVDKLYNLSYDLPINIHDEKVGTVKQTVENNIGLLVPTDEAMDAFFETYFKGRGVYDSWERIPASLRDIIVSTHIGQKAIYKKDLEDGFFNDEGDVVTYDIAKINETIYGSNCSFVGVNEVLVPLSFSKVSAPLLLDPMYSYFFAAISNQKLLSVLKKEPAQYSLFMKSNESFVRDSSMVVYEFYGKTYLYAYDDDRILRPLGSDYKLRRKLYGHIGIEPILDNNATKQFIETVDGRHIIIYKQDGFDLISGGEPSQYGYGSNTQDTIYNIYSKYDASEFGVTNGDNYTCDGWLNFTQNNLRNILENTKFFELLQQVGLNNSDNPGKLSTKERYTLFLPSNAALNNAQVDTLSKEDLTELLKFHFITGDFIFTDGRARSGAYKTYNGSRMNISTDVDMINILDENGQLYTTVPYSATANQIGTNPPDIKSEDYRTNVVVQPIDTVIYPY